MKIKEATYSREFDREFLQGFGRRGLWGHWDFTFVHLQQHLHGASCGAGEGRRVPSILRDFLDHDLDEALAISWVQPVQGIGRLRLVL